MHASYTHPFQNTRSIGGRGTAHSCGDKLIPSQHEQRGNEQNGLALLTSERASMTSGARSKGLRCTSSSSSARRSNSSMRPRRSVGTNPSGLRPRAQVPLPRRWLLPPADRGPSTRLPPTTPRPTAKRSATTAPPGSGRSWWCTTLPQSWRRQWPRSRIVTATAATTKRSVVLPGGRLLRTQGGERAE